jgi:Icc-related predicted phosphoesterase
VDASTAPRADAPKRVTPAPAPAYERCAGGAGAGEVKPLMLERYKLRVDGALLRASPAAMTRAQETTIVLGALADTKEALPATLQQLDELAVQLGRFGVTAIALLGGIDETYEGIKAVLERLQRVAPVLALPGDRESRSGFQAAAEAFPRRVIDLVRVRGVVLPGLSLVGVPGYHLPHHLLAREQGCSYGPREIDAVAARARALPAPRLLLAHGPPRGSGRLEVDRAFGQINIGDPLLRRLLIRGRVTLGLFGHVHESTGRATTVEGRPVPPMTWSASLLLNVGSADSVPHQDLRGRWWRATAAVIEVRGGRARYRMIHAGRAAPVVGRGN